MTSLSYNTLEIVANKYFGKTKMISDIITSKPNDFGYSTNLELVNFINQEIIEKSNYHFIFAYERVTNAIDFILLSDNNYEKKACILIEITYGEIWKKNNNLKSYEKCYNWDYVIKENDQNVKKIRLYKEDPNNAIIIDLDTVKIYSIIENDYWDLNHLDKCNYIEFDDEIKLVYNSNNYKVDESHSFNPKVEEANKYIYNYKDLNKAFNLYNFPSENYIYNHSNGSDDILEGYLLLEHEEFNESTQNDIIRKYPAYFKRIVSIPNGENSINTNIRSFNDNNKTFKIEQDESNYKMYNVKLILYPFNNNSSVNGSNINSINEIDYNLFIPENSNYINWTGNYKIVINDNVKTLEKDESLADLVEYKNVDDIYFYNIPIWSGLVYNNKGFKVSLLFIKLNQMEYNASGIDPRLLFLNEGSKLYFLYASNDLTNTISEYKKFNSYSDSYSYSFGENLNIFKFPEDDIFIQLEKKANIGNKLIYNYQGNKKEIELADNGIYNKVTIFFIKKNKYTKHCYKYRK